MFLGCDDQARGFHMATLQDAWVQEKNRTHRGVPDRGFDAATARWAFDPGTRCVSVYNEMYLVGLSSLCTG